MGGWDEFRDEDCDPIRVARLNKLDFRKMPEDVLVRVIDDYFPETVLVRDGEMLVCHIEEHLYTKYWEHKFSAYAFADARVASCIQVACVSNLTWSGSFPLLRPLKGSDLT
jgi:hypothetical protein